MKGFDPAAMPPLREVIAEHDLRARKSLGQNFLLDLNLTGRIARTAGDLAGCSVIEIGPGPGGLTRALLTTAAREIVAIERDSRCLGALADLEARAAGRLRIIEGDALKTDVEEICARPRAIVANLPYNVSTVLLIGWLDLIARSPDALDSMTLMFQREVAERLVAAPNSRAYGRLGVLSQWLCHVELAFDVPARAFTPPPKVTSTVVHFRPREKPLADADPATLQRVTATAFGQRRKMLRGSLAGLGVDPHVLLAKAGVTPTLRADAIAITDYCALARAFSAMTDKTSD
jgi:16S rRNA (adenine1518-N6/adenine1519-N6)-dimethyltransferase